MEWFYEMYLYYPELPRFSKWKAEDDKISIVDSKKRKIIEVQLKDDDLFCLEDETNNCVHIGFALSLPEIWQLFSVKSFYKAKKTKKEIEQQIAQDIENRKL